MHVRSISSYCKYIIENLKKIVFKTIIQLIVFKHNYLLINKSLEFVTDILALNKFKIVPRIEDHNLQTQI